MPFDRFPFHWCRYKILSTLHLFSVSFWKRSEVTWSLFLVTDGVSISGAVSTLVLKMFVRIQLPLRTQLYIYIYFNIWEILWICNIFIHFQQNLIQQFRYPHFRLVFSSVWSMDENDSTCKMSDYTDLNPLKKTLLFLGMSTLEYPVQPSIYH